MPAGSPILTVTPNPSLDVLYSADRLVWDDANRVPEPRIRPGGQGINVSRTVAALGGQVEAVALLGGVTGAEIRSLLASEPIGLHVVESTEPSRIALRSPRSISVPLALTAPTKSLLCSLRSIVLVAVSDVVRLTVTDPVAVWSIDPASNVSEPVAFTTSSVSVLMSVSAISLP